MSENEQPDQNEQALDPKEAMRQALERKKAAEHGANGHVATDRTKGAAHSQMGGKRQFRRKSGG